MLLPISGGRARAITGMWRAELPPPLPLPPEQPCSEPSYELSDLPPSVRLSAARDVWRDAQTWPSLPPLEQSGSEPSSKLPRLLPSKFPNPLPAPEGTWCGLPVQPSPIPLAQSSDELLSKLPSLLPSTLLSAAGCTCLDMLLAQPRSEPSSERPGLPPKAIECV